jgi:hypothetical protein
MCKERSSSLRKREIDLACKQLAHCSSDRIQDFLYVHSLKLNVQNVKKI